MCECVFVCECVFWKSLGQVESEISEKKTDLYEKINSKESQRSSR